ncbi:MAG TPA: glycosyltransferase family 4 protein [Nitrospiraceae bacterium]|jgi:glycosyltransferase involved in cell wall biosynthesis
MTEKPTLLIIGPTPPPYHGVAVAVETLMESDLRDSFHLVHLDLADRRGIAHVNNPDLHDVVLFIRQWCCLLGLLYRTRPTTTYLVMSQTTIGVLRDTFLMWPVLLAGSRVVAHLHGGHFKTWYESTAFVMKVYARIALTWIDRVIVLGESLRAQFEGLIPPDRITVVPNGIDVPAISTSNTHREYSERYRVLHLSTLNRQKGALVLLQAIPTILQARGNVEFVLAGPWSDPSDREEAMSLIHEHHLVSFVHLPGQVDSVHKLALLADADLFVFPGVQQEGQPLVVLEAMAAGLPIIYTNRGCLRETVIDGVSGLEVRCNDPGHLAERILWLLDHPAERLRMGKAAQRRQQQLFTKARHVEMMIKALQLVDNAA